MHLAILSDIHGNQYAFQAVMEDILKQKHLAIEKLLILGDTVGYYYHPEEIYSLLEKWPHLILRGNHEEMLLRALKEPGSLKTITSKYGHGIARAIKALSPKIIKSIASLPTRKDITIAGRKLCLCHGSPRDPNEYIYPNTSFEVLEACATASDGAEIIFMGHTHYPFAAKAGSAMLVSVGSVGQNRVRGGLASWTSYDTDNGSVRFFQTPYDTQALIEEVEKTDPDLNYLYEVLNR